MLLVNDPPPPINTERSVEETSRPRPVGMLPMHYVYSQSEYTKYDRQTRDCSLLIKHNFTVWYAERRKEKQLISRLWCSEAIFN